MDVHSNGFETVRDGGESLKRGARTRIKVQFYLSMADETLVGVIALGDSGVYSVAILNLLKFMNSIE